MGPRSCGAIHCEEEPGAVSVAGANYGASDRASGARATLADGAPLPSQTQTQGGSDAQLEQVQLICSV